MEHIATNTMFDKVESKKVTFRQDKQHLGGPPWVRGKYEVLDYATINRRWRNAARHAETDALANVSTDHYPLIVDLQVRLKAQEQRKTVDRKNI